MENFKIQTDLYLGKDFKKSIENIRHILYVSTTSLTTWLIFRGVLDYHNNSSYFMKSLKKYRYISSKTIKKSVEVKRKKKGKENLKTSTEIERNRIHLYISTALQDRLLDICKLEKNMELQELMNRMVKMEFNDFSKYLLHNIEEEQENNKKKINITLEGYILSRLNNISKMTGITLNGLIPLMIYEYLKILEEARYR